MGKKLELPAVTGTEHETEGSVLACTLDEEGNLYTFELDEKPQEESDRLTPEESVQVTREETESFISHPTQNLRETWALCCIPTVTRQRSLSL